MLSFISEFILLVVAGGLLMWVYPWKFPEEHTESLGEHTCHRHRSEPMLSISVAPASQSWSPKCQLGKAMHFGRKSAETAIKGSILLQSPLALGACHVGTKLHHFETQISHLENGDKDTCPASLRGCREDQIR